MAIKASCVDEFLAVAQKLINCTRKEPGCLTYNLYRDAFEPNTFFFYEEYADRQAQIYHSQQPYLNEFRTARESLLLEKPILKIQEAKEL